MKLALLAALSSVVLGCNSAPSTPPTAPTTPHASKTEKPSVDASPPAGPMSAKDVAQFKSELSRLPPLRKLRARYKTKLVGSGAAAKAPEVPPAQAPFELVRYPAAPGALAAYITKDPGDGKRHPAIIWITGGDNNSIGDVWSPSDPGNDQSATAYRKAGLVVMFPSQRGGNDNPGRREGFLGEVDDIVAARKYLAGVSYVDPTRVYLGGHSSGGTLALLVAESTDQFRAVFSFGPVAHVANYGGDLVYCDPKDENEMLLRSPLAWLKDIRIPTFVFEGTVEPGNTDSLHTLRQFSDNPLISFHEVAGATHFSILAPTNTSIATALLADTGKTPRISFDPAKLRQPFGK